MLASLSLAALLGSSAVRAATYSLTTSSVGSSFYNNFDFQNISDPTHGRVVYVTQATAQAANLTFASGDTFILRTDSRTTLSASGPGRQSVRLQSKRTYTTHVVVADLRHMPQGCATWPAIWELGPNWPNGGEVDIVEGVNDAPPNLSSLHTSAGCTMSGLTQTGTLVSTDCNANVNSNTGCGVRTNKANSYGPAFNSAGGGFFAMERTSTAIKVWFWGRSESGIPSDVLNGASSVNTSNWGTPVASFNNANCDIASKFAAANIIINLTLCGDWAGSVWGSSACASNGACDAYVNNNPSAFSNAYFDFKGLRVYA
ncbi:glycoside hydrolase family 16 protein [Auricularia subglabra TFB-10046 SS5]|nr:glycoside hydrolase family 16 protein [Auricularia subglabra TFB-10046 SS5]